MCRGCIAILIIVDASQWMYQKIPPYCADCDEKISNLKVMSFCDGFVPGSRPKIFFDRFSLFQLKVESESSI